MKRLFLAASIIAACTAFAHARAHVAMPDNGVIIESPQREMATHEESAYALLKKEAASFAGKANVGEEHLTSMSLHTFNAAAEEYLRLAQFIHEGSVLYQMLSHESEGSEHLELDDAAREWLARAPAAAQAEALAADAMAQWFLEYTEHYCERLGASFDQYACEEHRQEALRKMEVVTKAFSDHSDSLRTLREKFSSAK